MVFAKGYVPWNKGKTASEETRKKLSAALVGNKRTLGCKLSEGHKRRISEASKGNKYNLGRKHTEEQKKRIGEKSKECWSDPVYRAKMHASRKGRTSPNKGRTLPEEQKEKISESLKGNKHLLGHKHSPETKRKISLALKGNPKVKAARRNRKITDETKRKISEANRGEKCYLWKGGKSFEPYCPQFSRRLKEEVRNAFGRRCFLCGAPENGRKLDVHHCDYDKGQGCGKRWNLVPLCKSCHTKTSNHRHFYFNLLSNYWALKYIEDSPWLSSIPP